MGLDKEKNYHIKLHQSNYCKIYLASFEIGNFTYESFNIDPYIIEIDLEEPQKQIVH